MDSPRIQRAVSPGWGLAIDMAGWVMMAVAVTMNLRGVHKWRRKSRAQLGALHMIAGLPDNRFPPNWVLALTEEQAKTYLLLAVAEALQGLEDERVTVTHQPVPPEDRPDWGAS